ncbi:YobI family P-loop NTPase [Natronoflexus pectinivorans]|uniref:YobI-like P-loop NTPase domain-containing protein n=1 Tax=Natronoflexus pectinivorans TaxID=682526 RepID=A0A4R2G436_9BACT|nr:hypothetical protein [Natronoflexus pectinivorans]TCO02445.1 hypothetical protein EV194_12410 [Natronoflexus pectinivorans]
MFKDRFIRFKNLENKVSEHYNSLSPIDDAEDCEVYLEALEWALANKHKNKNIAVSGSYGSGKSSIIKTFIKRTQASENLWNKFFPKNRFFNISLATFKDSQHKDTDDNKDTELQRLIELSIIQQLFFHEKDSKIPDSRFKKIKRQKKIKLFGYSLGIIVVLISLLFLLAPDFLGKLSLLNPDRIYPPYFNKIASAITLLGLFLTIYKLSRSLLGLSIKKLNINTAEIEIDNGISKSILNNHLDEIIYFFEATKYNVVIIEDLDRFEQTDVFTKLREINLLINSSEKVKRDVVFIYAIKDDMFLDKDRAKFFDFIIPIIPVINFSNSGAKLRKIVGQSNYNLNDDLLDDLSMFIDDMRLLYNIMNEFYIYSKKISNSLDMNKLLSIIVYKNIYPNDFTKLNENQGDLYLTISKKSDYIKTTIVELDNQITVLKTEISRIEEHKVSNLKELRIIYIAKVLEKITNGFVGFNVNKNLVSISNFTSEENFQKIRNGSIEYFFHDSYSGRHRNSFDFNFTAIENEVNPEISYSEREKIILTKIRTNEIKKEIERINEQKKLIQKSKLKDLLQSKQIVIETDSHRRFALINILLRNGYIDENYLDYISVFHEGALTKPDYLFLINIKTDKGNAFDYKLNKTEELIKKINEFAFEKDFVLNYDLVDTLIKGKYFTPKKNLLFQQLSNEKEKTFYFIDEFIDRTAYIENFISELCKFWPNIWNFLYSKTRLPDDRIEIYFNLIIQYAEIKDITTIFENNSDYICNFPDFLNIKTKSDKLIEIIRNLNLKFNSIEINSPEPLLSFIFENNHYAVNSEMIQLYTSFKNVYDAESFQLMNYSFILNTKLQNMIDYIESNIEEYIENVFLKLQNNTEEYLESYEKLLNNEDICIEQKEEIIIKTSTIIEDVHSIITIEVKNLLLIHSKIKAKWLNILAMFVENGNMLSDDVISFINNPQNAQVLSNLRMTTDKDENGLQTFSKLCRALVNEMKIDTKSLELICNSIPWWYESFTTDNLSKERITILIESKKVNPTPISFKYLRDNFKGTNILLLEKHFSNFKELIDELIIDSDDLKLILMSKVIDTKSKFTFVNNLDDSIVLENTDNAGIIVKLLLDSESYDVKASLKSILLLNNDLTPRERISLFINSKSIINDNLITNFLHSLGNDYELIADTSKKATIENNTLHSKLLNTLIEFEYISSISEIKNGLRVNHRR